MKTINRLSAGTARTLMTLAFVHFLAALTQVYSQETKSVFGADAEIGFVWGIELKTSSIQHEPATQYGMFAGALFNHAVMVGAVGAANVTHPRVNYGYTGLMVQYTCKPANLVHMSVQVTLGSGSAKDYENEKSSMLDNFGNVTGAKFYFAEPGINGEINLGAKTRLVLGVGYRYVHGIDINSEHVARTHLTDSDLSGFNITAGVKFGLY